MTIVGYLVHSSRSAAAVSSGAGSAMRVPVGLIFKLGISWVVPCRSVVVVSSGSVVVMPRSVFHLVDLVFFVVI